MAKFDLTDAEIRLIIESLNTMRSDYCVSESEEQIYSNLIQRLSVTGYVAHFNEPATISARSIHEFNQYLRNCTDAQVCGVYEKEKQAGRDAYAELAAQEAQRRGYPIGASR